MHAARGGKQDIVQCLVTGGANVNAVNNDRWTSLVHAARNGKLDVVQYLVDVGADVNVIDNNGWKLLMHAVWSGELGVVQYLLDRGADVNAVDNDGDTPLIVATPSAHLEVVQYLADSGADFNAGNNDGWAPLIHAASSGKLDVVQYLVDRGVDANLKTADGQTTSLLATKHGYVAIRTFLLQHGERAPTDGDSSEDVNADSFLASSTLISTSRSWAISPFDIELMDYVDEGTVGGEYHAKWLDADVVVKLFVPDASASTFAEEVTVWHQLRHPNAIKLYGACDVGHSFFVLEYASNGSLVEYLDRCKRKGERRTPWKFLHEAALGHAYLHERKIVHGNLRSINMVGSDSVAKLSDFALTVSTHGDGVHSSATNGRFGSVRWHAPEQLEGKGGGSSFAADIYSFGLCVLEAVSERAPWEGESDQSIAFEKGRWDPASEDSTGLEPGPLDADTCFLASRMCGLSPDQLVTAAFVVRMLEGLTAREANENDASRPQTDPIKMNVEEYKNGTLTKLWNKLRGFAPQYDKEPLYHLVFLEIEATHEYLVQASQPWKLLEMYHSLLVNLDDAMRPGSYRNRVAALSLTRATDTNLTALQRRVYSLWTMLDDSRASNQERELRWEAQRKKQLELFMSEVSQTVMALSKMDDEEDQSAFAALLKSEISNHASDYTEGQLAVTKKA